MHGMDKPTDDNLDSESRTVYETPEVKAIEVIRDPDHPEAGKGGIVPPVETRFKPGDPRIKPGKRVAGATYAEWTNQLQDAEPDELMALIQAPRGVPALKKAVARDILARGCPGDLADFEDYCEGRITLQQARERGIPTDWLKKVKVRTTTDKDGNTETTREIELKDEAHRAIERVLDRTSGKPSQSVQVDHTGEVQHRHRIVLETRSPGTWPEAGETLRLPDPDDEGPKPAA